MQHFSAVELLFEEVSKRRGWRFFVAWGCAGGLVATDVALVVSGVAGVGCAVSFAGHGSELNKNVSRTAGFATNRCQMFGIHDEDLGDVEVRCLTQAHLPGFQRVLCDRDAFVVLVYGGSDGHQCGIRI